VHILVILLHIITAWNDRNKLGLKGVHFQKQLHITCLFTQVTHKGGAAMLGCICHNSTGGNAFKVTVQQMSHFWTGYMPIASHNRLPKPFVANEIMRWLGPPFTPVKYVRQTFAKSLLDSR
jgi:hypothetical protein